MSRNRCAWMVLLLLGVLPVLAGCSKKQQVSPVPISGERSKAGAMLAYEQVLRISLPGSEIAGRVAAARQACETARIGACNVLRIEQAEHDAELVVRIVPEGVEPMAKLAAQGGAVGFRRTTAEVLADAVNDNQRQRELLQKHGQHMASWQHARTSPLPISSPSATSRFRWRASCNPCRRSSPTSNVGWTPIGSNCISRMRAAIHAAGVSAMSFAACSTKPRKA